MIASLLFASGFVCFAYKTDPFTDLILAELIDREIDLWFG